MKPTIWFLDIDGVINSIGAPLPDSGVDPSLYKLTQVASHGSEWPIHSSSKVVTFINEMSRSDLAEIR